MTTVPASTRSTTYTLASASAGPFLVGFRIFDATLAVYVNGAVRTDWTLSATFSGGYCDTGEVTFDVDLAIGDVVTIDGAMPVARGEDYINPDPNLTTKMNIELARIWAAIQQVARDVGRTPDGLQQAFTYFHDVRDYGAISPGDVATARDAAFAAASDGDTILYPEGSWTCSTSLTMSGSKRVFFIAVPGAVFDTDADYLRAVPEQATSSLGFKHRQHSTSKGSTSGGEWFISAQRAASGSATSYEWDAVRISFRAADPSEGVSWGGGGADKTRDQVGLHINGYVPTGNLTASMFCLNPYVWFPAGTNGTAKAIEVNLDIDNSIADVIENFAFAKNGIIVNAKPGKRGTIAFGFGGTDSGTEGGWYKGYYAEQKDVINHIDARFAEYKDLFEVMYDGRVLVGKGASSNMTPGVEIAPAGEVFVTKAAAAVQMKYGRSTALTGAADLREDTDSFKNSTGVEKIGNRMTVSVTDHNNGTEDTEYEWETTTAGTLAARLRLSTALNALVPIQVNGTQVVNTRVTGWAAATGTATRTTFATGSVTTAQLAERVKALIDDLTTHGLIGA